MCFCSLRTQQQEGKNTLQGAVVILNILNGLQSGAKLPLKLLYNQPGDAGYLNLAIILSVASVFDVL